jgi:hypothetical protein
MSSTLLACHGAETVFLSATLQRSVLIWQGASAVEITERTEGLGLFTEAIRLLLRISVTRIAFAVRFGYANNLGTAFS